MRGRKPLLIFLIAPLLLLLSGCGGGGSSSSFSPPSDPPGLPFSLTILPSQSIAQTNSSIIINAEVRDGNGAPVPNVAVTFTNLSEPFGVIKTSLAKLGIMKSIGLLSATVATTNSIGIASVSISSTIQGFATVQAEISNSVGISRAKKTFFFATSFDLAPTLQLTTDNPVLFEGPNDNQSNIIATVRDRFGLLAFGSTVTFGADFAFRVGADPTVVCSDGTKTCSVTFPNGNTGTTNSSGQTSTLVRVDPTFLRDIDTVLNITATADNGAFNLISLLLKPVTISGTNSTLSASPDVVQVTKTSTITAGVVLNTGAPTFDNTAVNFFTTCGTIDPFGLTTGGIATATFTAPAAVPAGGTCTVSASVAGVPIGTPIPITVVTAFTVLPETQTVDGVNGATGASAPKFQISGGIAPYTVVSDNTLFLPIVASDGKSFSVNVPAGSQPVTVTYTVQDNAGTTVQVKLVITGQGALALTPTTLAINTTGGAGSVTVHYLVSGGKAPYTVFFTLTSPVTPSIANGTTLPLPTTPPINQQSFDVTYSWTGVVTAETFQMIVVDSLGASQTSTNTVTGTLPTPTPTPVPTPTPTPTPAPDFTVACVPGILTPPGVATSVCTVTALGGFSSPVVLSCSAIPAPLAASSCAFSVPVLVSGTSSLTFTCVGGPGSAAFTVNGTSGSTVHNAAMAVTCP